MIVFLTALLAGCGSQSSSIESKETQVLKTDCDWSFNCCMTGPDNIGIIRGCELWDYDLDRDVDLADFSYVQIDQSW